MNGRLPLYREDPISKIIMPLEQGTAQEYRSDRYIFKSELSKDTLAPGIMARSNWSWFGSAADAEKFLNKTQDWPREDRIPLLQDAYKYAFIGDPREKAKLTVDYFNKVHMSLAEQKYMVKWMGGQDKVGQVQNLLIKNGYVDQAVYNNQQLSMDWGEISANYLAKHNGSVAEYVFGPAPPQLKPNNLFSLPANWKPPTKPKPVTGKRISRTAAATAAMGSMLLRGNIIDKIAGMMAMSLEQVYANMPKAAKSKG